MSTKSQISRDFCILPRPTGGGDGCEPPWPGRHPLSIANHCASAGWANLFALNGNVSTLFEKLRERNVTDEEIEALLQDLEGGNVKKSPVVRQAIN